VTNSDFKSWGLYPDPSKLVQEIRLINSYSQVDLSTTKNGYLLPFGNGRSYGDSCLNNGGTLIHTKGLNRLIKFDKLNGILRCEAGVLLSDIIDLILPHGWFLSVTPGTKFITVGGAVSNDIHGKNHHRMGSFGCHIRSFELIRSNGEILECSNDQNKNLFAATIGGLGLTGLISWVEFSLLSVKSAFMDQEIICFNNLDEFFHISDNSDNEFEYTVAWIDCLAKGSKIGKGVFKRAMHSETGGLNHKISRKKNFPILSPFPLINKYSLRLFNNIYSWSNSRNQGYSFCDIESFFYPLDSINNWNRIYGKNGFLQYQFVIPMSNAPDVIKEILERISISQQGSFLAVLKIFGDIASPGMLSFSRKGVSLALDFPNKGVKLFNLLNELDAIVNLNGGAIYPAKDARMSNQTFCSSFPNYNEFSKLIDPAFSSSFWRRVMASEV
jgi:FAD/FMN-containing dehydrogenase